jgi:hypothetical protein
MSDKKPSESRDGRIGRQPENIALPKLLRAIAGGSNAREGAYDEVLLQAAAELDEAWDSVVEGAELIGRAVNAFDALDATPRKATSIQLAHCSNPDCLLAHIALFNDDNEIIATAVVDEAAVNEINNWLGWLARTKKE